MELSRMLYPADPSPCPYAKAYPPPCNAVRPSAYRWGQHPSQLWHLVGQFRVAVRNRHPAWWRL
jgi:hypothetical protein